jgi:serine/threonine protein kinase
MLRNIKYRLFINKTAITPCYTAPELFSEDGIFSYKTEIWALGCILFELATGQVPFFEESVAKLINKIVNEELNFTRLERLNFSEEFVEIIKKMLEKVDLPYID